MTVKKTRKRSKARIDAVVDAYDYAMLQKRLADNRKLVTLIKFTSEHEGFAQAMRYVTRAARAASGRGEKARAKAARDASVREAWIAARAKGTPPGKACAEICQLYLISRTTRKRIVRNTR